jgi:hypothetical protein
MASVPYLTGAESPTPAIMNALVGGLNAKLTTILGGRSPAIAIKASAGNSATVNGHTTFSYTGVPYAIFGKCIFFTAGRTTYSQYLPGALPVSVNVADPVTGVVTSQPSVMPYNHALFTGAAAAAVVTAYDTALRIATIEDFGDAYYTLPQYWWKTVSNMSLLEHSLEAHTVTHEEREYFLQETGAPVPEKVYDWSLAEIVLEGQTAVDLQVCPLARFKYRNLRLHNLNPAPASVTLPDGAVIALAAFECVSYRQNEERTQFEVSTHRYFQTYRDNDPRLYWFWPGTPSKTGASSLGNSFNVWTAAAGMQGNNLSNPSVIYDWVQWLNADPVFAADGPWASFIQDPHEVCDITSRYLAKFGDPANPATLVGDLFHHRGMMIVAKIHNTLKDPVNGISPLATFHQVRFRGYATLAADLIAAGLNITVDTDSSGNLRLRSTDPNYTYDVIGVSTNLLKGVTLNNNPNAAFDLYTSFIHSGVTAIGITTGEAKLFESGFNQQDSTGRLAFALGATSRYRLQHRTLSSAVNERQYRGNTGPFITVSGPPLETLTLKPLSSAKAMVGFHNVPVSELLNLSYFGDPALGSQNNAYVTFADIALRYTPEGLVLTFTERVPFGYVTPISETRTNSSFGFNVSPLYKNFSNRAYSLSADGLSVELKHAIRFRGHGFGWGQHGRANSAWFSPLHGRQTVHGLAQEVRAADGADFDFPDQLQSETDVQLLRRISPSLDLTCPTPGGRFFLMYRALDAVNQFAANHQSRIGGLHPWYQYQPVVGQSNRNIVTNSNHALQRNCPNAPGLMMMPLLLDHYNALAQTINQCKTGRVLDWRALRIVWGSRVVDFNTLILTEAFDYESSPGVPAEMPAPIDAFCRVDTQAWFGGSVTFNPSWKEFFQAHGVPIKTGVPAAAARAEDRAEFREVKIQIHAEYKNVAHNAGVVSYTERSTLSDWFFNPVTYGVAGAAYIATPLPVDRFGISWSRGLLTSTQLPQSAPLPAYATIQWVALNDAKAYFTALGFPFVYTELIYPLTLDTFETPTTLQKRGFENAQEHEANFSTAGNAFAAAVIASRAPLNLTNGLTDGVIATKFTVWRMEADAPTFKMPLRLTNVTTNEPVASTLTVFERVNDRTPGRGRFHLAEALHVSWSGVENRFVVSGDLTTAFPFLVPTAKLKVIMDLADAEGDQLEPYERYMQWLLRESQWFAFQITASAGAAAQQDAYLLPQSQWGRVPDWWLADQETFIGSQLLVATEQYRSIPAPSGAVKITATANAVTPIRATGEGAYRTYFELPRNATVVPL